MDWILSHLGLVATLVIFFIGWLSQLRQNAAKTDKGAPRRRTISQPTRPVAADSPVEDQVRRIQEEIRRKILERTGQATPPKPATAQPPALPRTSVTPPSRPMPRRTVPAEPVRKTVPVAPALQKTPSAPPKENYMEEQRRSEERRRESRKIDQASIQSANAMQASANEGPNPWSAELRDPNSLRRALVLREVLGPPVSMRR